MGRGAKAGGKKKSCKVLFLAPTCRMICESLQMRDTAERECKAPHLHFLRMRFCVSEAITQDGFILIGILEEVLNAACCLNSSTVQTPGKVDSRAANGAHDVAPPKIPAINSILVLCARTDRAHRCMGTHTPTHTHWLQTPINLFKAQTKPQQLVPPGFLTLDFSSNKTFYSAAEKKKALEFFESN